jgi:ABC-type uncharacterized transport system permease subunit
VPNVGVEGTEALGALFTAHHDTLTARVWTGGPFIGCCFDAGLNDDYIE